jgi:2,4-dienoyl-CoA reductase-like NADH-dependent reductase (Old Yellow Enzyme family)
MSKLFEATTINTITLKNRFVRSATWEGMANDDGSCTPRLIDLMAELACGGVGLIITGHAYVSREGQAGPWQLGLYSDELLPGLAKMAETVHKADGTIVIQIAHAGCFAAFELTGLELLGPSDMEIERGPYCREMTHKEINRIVEAFGQAATRAKSAGFDGVQIHAAHGYLLSQFLSPFFNKRKDEYGGSVENRARIVLEIVQTIKAALGNNFAVLIKMNSEDFLDGGFSVEEVLQVAKIIQKAGIDAIELSGGSICSGKYIPIRKGRLDCEEKEVYYREAARRYKETINVPLMLVGGIRSYGVAEQLVEDGITDYVSLCRPLIREPDLINRWKSGDTRKATCQSDNLCFKPLRQGEGLYCVVEEKSRNKKTI